MVFFDKLKIERLEKNTMMIYVDDLLAYLSCANVFSTKMGTYPISNTFDTNSLFLIKSRSILGFDVGVENV